MQGVYLISPEVLPVDFYQRLEIFLQTGLVAIFQLRLKPNSYSLSPVASGSFDDTLEYVGLRCQELCSKYQVPFILNDHAHLACQFNFDGVHIGKDDKTPPCNLKIKGSSCYDNLELALTTATSMDYIAFGSFFPTRTKKTEARAIPQLIYNFKQKHPHVPVCAIGGINESNYKLLEYRGIRPDLIAIISAIWGNTNQNCFSLLNKLNEFTKQKPVPYPN